MTLDLALLVETFACKFLVGGSTPPDGTSLSLSHSSPPPPSWAPLWGSLRHHCSFRASPGGSSTKTCNLWFLLKTLHWLANWLLKLDFKQPHLHRTKLCDMKDAELDPLYVEKREKLKELVASIIRPKIVQGKSLNGKEFVSFLEQVLGFACSLERKE